MSTYYTSKLSSQGQVSIPTEVRKRLEVEPGSIIEWVDDGDTIIVRRKGSYSWPDAHALLFPEGPPPRRSLEEMTTGIRQSIEARHGRR